MNNCEQFREPAGLISRLAWFDSTARNQSRPGADTSRNAMQIPGDLLLPVAHGKGIIDSQEKGRVLLPMGERGRCNADMQSSLRAGGRGQGRTRRLDEGLARPAVTTPRRLRGRQSEYPARERERRGVRLAACSWPGNFPKQPETDVTARRDGHLNSRKEPTKGNERAQSGRGKGMASGTCGRDTLITGRDGGQGFASTAVPAREQCRSKPRRGSLTLASAESARPSVHTHGGCAVSSFPADSRAGTGERLGPDCRSRQPYGL